MSDTTALVSEDADGVKSSHQEGLNINNGEQLSEYSLIKSDNSHVACIEFCYNANVFLKMKGNHWSNQIAQTVK